MSDPATASGQGAVWRDEVRGIEARVDARFQAVSARFSTGDRRHDAVAQRIDQTEQGTIALTNRCDARFRWIDDRFDATDVCMELLEEHMATRLAKLRQQLRRTAVLAAAGTASGWAVALLVWLA